eukprot:1975109-Rhodomonas_salina.1
MLPLRCTVLTLRVHRSVSYALTWRRRTDTCRHVTAAMRSSDTACASICLLRTDMAAALGMRGTDLTFAAPHLAVKMLEATRAEKVAAYAPMRCPVPEKAVLLLQTNAMVLSYQ